MFMAGQNGIQRRLIELFRDKLELDVPSAETDLMETGVMDSLTFVELLFHLEREFGITISNDKLELEHFRSIVSIVAFIEQAGEPNATLGDQRTLLMRPQTS
jgi:acyl carrier protein